MKHLKKLTLLFMLSIFFLHANGSFHTVADNPAAVSVFMEEPDYGGTVTSND